MRRLLWLGAPFFARSLESAAAAAGCDWQVRLATIHRPRVLDWDDVVAANGGHAPDVLVFGDNSCPPALAGVERYPCLTVFYDVDSHIHEWHAFYAQCFDLCLVSLKDHLGRFLGRRLGAERVRWSPAFARDDDRAAPGVAPEWDLLFVGKVDAQLTPARHDFLRALGARLPALAVRQGDYRALYPRARLVLNVAERGDLNFRFFEAPACGACLLAPCVGHGLEELFAPGREMLLYEPGDVEGVARLAEDLLADPGRRADVAAAGLARVDAEHRAAHRARAFLGWLEGFAAAALVGERLAVADFLYRNVLRLLYLHWAEVSPPELAVRYLAAAR
ncbi:MAG: glycosyltransferase family 1 protein [Desulfovibrionaceae bacterium]|jgi:hypothetical protein|nr:glycosyltransferase family 1 protein [Desulfovibrionaceae bacterium]